MEYLLSCMALTFTVVIGGILWFLVFAILLVLGFFGSWVINLIKEKLDEDS